MIVNRIGLGSAMKMGCIASSVAGFFAGLFWGILFAFFSSFLASAVSGRDPGFGAGMVVMLPIFFAVVFGMLGGFISFLGALIYNISAGAFGGIELVIDTREAPGLPEPAGNISMPEAINKKTHRIWKQPPSGLAARRGGFIR